MKYRWNGDWVVLAIEASNLVPMRAGWLLAYTGWLPVHLGGFLAGRFRPHRGKRFMRRIGVAALVCWSVLGVSLVVSVSAAVSMAAANAAPLRIDADAVRLNNRGVAQMGQQFTEKAADTFAAAMKQDPKLAQAAIN